MPDAARGVGAQHVGLANGVEFDGRDVVAVLVQLDEVEHHMVRADAGESEALRAAYAARTPELLANQLTANKIVWADPERRKNISEIKKAWWAAKKAASNTLK